MITFGQYCEKLYTMGKRQVTLGAAHDHYVINCKAELRTRKVMPDEIDEDPEEEGQP